MSMATPCAAAQCTVVAASAVQWLDLRAGGTRAEPICAGHEQVMLRLIREHARDPWIVNPKIITLTEYAARRAREQTTVFVDAMRDLFDAGATRFPPPA